jgi:hypothetical protein
VDDYLECFVCHPWKTIVESENDLRFEVLELMDRLPKNLGPDVCRLSEMYTEDESAA